MRIVAAAIKYLTNHIIMHIPSRRIRSYWLRYILGWRFGPNVSILMGQYIQMAGIRTSGKKVSIGKGTVINHGCFLYTTGGLSIGEQVSISSGAWLITGTHDMNAPDFPDDYKPIVIGDHAWIGVRATILGGITIGKGAVVMAGAMVTKDVPPYAVVGGIPAKMVAERQLHDLTYEFNFRPLFE